MRAPVCGALCALAWLLGTGSAAGATLDFDPCPGTPDYECTAFDVPLDPAGGTPGTLRLHARRLIESRDAPAVLVALAGGPGQSSTRFIEDFADVLAEGLENRQLVVLDTRGTGDSGALSCPALDDTPPAASAAELVPRVERCGEELGERRRFYTTTEVVADLEALRQGLGVERVSLFGVSYGTYVAQRYARRFPEHVDRLVLDSIVAQDQGGPFDRSSYTAVPAALRRACRDGRCRGITRHPDRDIRRLAARLARRAMRATVYDRNGRGRTLAVRGETELFDLLVSSDLSPALRDALPAAVSAALRGDPAPLVRLAAVDAGTADPREFDEENEQPEEFSNALFFATTCQEKPLPWDSPETPRDERPARRDAAIAALGPRPFAPFGRSAYASTQVGTAFCERWPETRIAPVPAPGPIGAPALLLSGLTDLRTPPHEALGAAASIADASLVRVPGAAHSLVSSRLQCVQTALIRFFAGRAVGNPCAGPPPRLATPHPAPVPPTSVRRVAPRGIAGGHRRVLAGVLATIEDASRTATTQGLLDRPYAFGGLRGGRACVWPGEQLRSGRRLVEVRLARFAFVPRLAVSGRATVDGDRVVRMRVALRRGRLRLQGRRVSGRLDGRPVRRRIPRRAAAVERIAVSPSPGAGRC